MGFVFFFRKTLGNTDEHIEMAIPSQKRYIEMEFSYVIWANTLNLNKQRITWPRRETKFLFECWKKFEQVKYFLTWKKKFRIFKKPCNVLLLLVYKHQWNTKTFHFNIFFGCEWCDLSCSHRNNVHFTSEDNMLFLHEKVSCFYTEAHRHLIGGCITSKIFIEGFEEQEVMYYFISSNLEVPLFF